MVKRLLDCNSSDFRQMTKADLREAIRASEGRVMVSEMIGAFQPLLLNISNAELAAAFGADLLLLNMFDLFQPVFNGLPPTAPADIIKTLKRLTGRIVGINLEPVAERHLQLPNLPGPGRRVSVETAQKACEMGADWILLTGNPETSVDNEGILQGIATVKNVAGAQLLIAAGKMHAAGIAGETGVNIITQADIQQFIAAGADIILLPAPGTVPGITMDFVRELVVYAHELGALTMTSIGTSQEGADEQTIRQIALMCKMTGTDLHHIGDAGYPGMAVPENLMAYSIAIRGRRHTYARMARSINR
ncbi:hypothetical protein [Acetonema longum]|uniref:DUF7916 domain-containing protein n=1 Tax=Acetonema longum DSM 6540 TaxID=1009370 RepID=F7NJ49_9FIRM|nr:hypothetical protein [Acetonema longum]EGO63939.1 hypothetical protein ALO_10524 [Acetonema longum DSM 6540]